MKNRMKNRLTILTNKVKYSQREVPVCVFFTRQYWGPLHKKKCGFRIIILKPARMMKKGKNMALSERNVVFRISSGLIAALFCFYQAG
jgi:hypothetical protein